MLSIGGWSGGRGFYTATTNANGSINTAGIASLVSYDLHGAWNQYVGPNVALYDDGNDGELKAGSAYQYQNIGYLNTDWAAHYYRGALQAGHILSMQLVAIEQEPSS